MPFPFTYFVLLLEGVAEPTVQESQFGLDICLNALITWHEKREVGSSCLVSSIFSAFLQKIMSILNSFFIDYSLYLHPRSSLNSSFFTDYSFYLHPRSSYSPLSSPPSHQRSPCVRVPHLCFGCCADGSLLVLHNGSKVTVAHAINAHSKFSSPAVSFASFCSFY